jgi:cytochrome bd-type quinol oxidase subunit 1
MNGAHLHLLVNHLPVIGSIFAILLLMWSLARKNTDIARAALGIFVLAAITGLAAYFTGEPAEHMAEDIAGVSRSMIHTHEESAELATVLLGGYGVLALGALLYLRKRAAEFPRKLMTLALLLSFVPAGAMGWTANQGGKIRHPEITGAGAPTATSGASTDVAKHENGDRAPERSRAPRH